MEFQPSSGAGSDFAVAAPGWPTAQIFSLGDMNQLIAQLLSELARASFGERDLFGIRLALEEAMVNGIKHGNQEDPKKPVLVAYFIQDRHFTIHIADQGSGFNPQAVPDPLAPENLERPGGRGVFLMRHYMSHVEYNERGNVVTLKKVL